MLIRLTNNYAILKFDNMDKNQPKNKWKYLFDEDFGILIRSKMNIRTGPMMYMQKTGNTIPSALVPSRSFK